MFSILLFASKNGKNISKQRGTDLPERHLIGDEDVVERVHAGEQVGDAQHDEHVALVEAEGAELRQRRL